MAMGIFFHWRPLAAIGTFGACEQGVYLGQRIPWTETMEKYAKYQCLKKNNKISEVQIGGGGSLEQGGPLNRAGSG